MIDIKRCYPITLLLSTYSLKKLHPIEDMYSIDRSICIAFMGLNI